MSCEALQSQICGGPNANSVYSIAKSGLSQYCASQDDCITGLTCADWLGKCLSDLQGSCSTINDCVQSWMVCSNSKCLSPKNQYCIVDADCASSQLSCSQNQCLSAYNSVCQLDTDCIQGLSCQNNICLAKSFDPKTSFNDSLILNDPSSQLRSILIPLLPFTTNYPWSLLYRGSRDGFAARAFHAKCDGNKNTLTVIKVASNGFVFGGFTSVPWDSSSTPPQSNTYLDSKAFIFSLKNAYNNPFMAFAEINEPAIYSNPNWGPVFGSGFDIYMGWNNAPGENVANFGGSYKTPIFANGISGLPASVINPIYGSTQAQTLLANSLGFIAAEIEVYSTIVNVDLKSRFFTSFEYEFENS